MLKVFSTMRYRLVELTGCGCCGQAWGGRCLESRVGQSKRLLCAVAKRQTKLLMLNILKRSCRSRLRLSDSAGAAAQLLSTLTVVDTAEMLSAAIVAAARYAAMPLAPKLKLRLQCRGCCRWLTTYVAETYFNCSGQERSELLPVMLRCEGCTWRCQ